MSEEGLCPGSGQKWRNAVTTEDTGSSTCKESAQALFRSNSFFVLFILCVFFTLIVKYNMRLEKYIK